MGGFFIERRIFNLLSSINITYEKKLTPNPYFALFISPRKSCSSHAFSGQEGR
ncbi:hypothetical protein SAMN05421761_10670 [Belliella pelovolcani]|uniref:Uncharacterized protein n=1 Tax=Belliella pelovolcani TaxID=529505 RepID=A0A1N7MGJ1_9BACT|nr:hypothetical protein SAMN05421761_10670 [Belliella pelovolcani]